MQPFSKLHKQFSNALSKVSLKQIIGLFLVFGLLKGLAFISPLLLSEICDDPLLFGEFEYAFNLGMTLMGVFAMGLPAAYAFFVLKNGRTEMVQYFHLHFLLLAGLLLLTFSVYPPLINNLYFGAAVVGVMMANQIMTAAILKVNGNNNLSIIADTGIYILLTAIVAYLYLTESSYTNQLWFSALLIVILGFTLVYHLRRCGFKNFVFKRAVLAELYKFGVLIVLAAPLVFLINNNTRLFIKHYLDLEQVGHYSFFFRIASALLLVSRVIHILLFRRIFISEHQTLDRYMAYVLLAISGLMAACLVVYYTPLGNSLLSYFPNYQPYASILPLCFFQVLFWINTSFFEAILTREKRMKQFIILLVIVFVMMLLTLQFVDMYGTLSLKSIIVINVWAIFTLFLGQHLILVKSGIYYKKTIVIHLIFGMFYAAYLILF